MIRDENMGWDARSVIMGCSSNMVGETRFNFGPARVYCGMVGYEYGVDQGYAIWWDDLGSMMGC